MAAGEAGVLPSSRRFRTISQPRSPAWRKQVALAVRTIECLGGPQNVTRLEVCPTRLRVEVVNPALVDVAGLHALGVFGVVICGHIVQVVVGGAAAALAENFQAELSQLTSV
jgi:phosphotransferase system IIB component